MALRSREAAAKQLYDDVCCLFLNSPPQVPAWNKWTKITPSIIWFAGFCSLHTMLASCLQQAAEALENEKEKEDLEQAIVDNAAQADAAAVGMDDNAAFQAQETARFRKTANWLSSPITPSKMTALCLAVQPCLRILGSLFKTSSRFEQTPGGQIMPLLEQPSPVTRTIAFYFQVLRDEDHGQWRSLAGPSRPWSSELYTMASAPMWLIIAHLHVRLVMTFQQWPLRLGRLVLDDLTADEKLALANQFYACQACCLDPFSRWLRATFPSAPTLLTDEGMFFLHKLFLHIPCTNVQSENRFSKQTRHAHSSMGSAPEPGTLECNHVLTESKTLLDAHYRPVCVWHFLLFECVVRVCSFTWCCPISLEGTVKCTALCCYSV